MAIASTFQFIQNDVATQMNLSPQETIVKSLNRCTRKFEYAFPQIPHGKDFEITDNFEDFVAYVKGVDEPDRFIIFALTKLLFPHETTKYLWFGDGTFKQFLGMFHHLYTFHVTTGGDHPPCIYGLFPNKT